MKRANFALCAILLLLVGIVLPNLLWLGRSTVRITNEGPAPAGPIWVKVEGETRRFEGLAPGQSRFALLPRSGDASFELRLSEDPEAPAACQAYVQGDMFHVEVAISGIEARCDATLPLVSELLVLKLL